MIGWFAIIYCPFSKILETCIKRKKKKIVLFWVENQSMYSLDI